GQGCPALEMLRAGRRRRLAAGAARKVQEGRGSGGIWRAGSPPVFLGRREAADPAGGPGKCGKEAAGPAGCRARRAGGGRGWGAGGAMDGRGGVLVGRGAGRARLLAGRRSPAGRKRTRRSTENGAGEEAT